MQSGVQYWSLRKWLQSLALHESVAAAIAIPAGHDAYEFMRALSQGELRRRLHRAGMQGLADEVAHGLTGLREQLVPTAQAYSAKFVATSYEMTFASTKEFFGGLEALIGSPLMLNGSVLSSMDHEHLHSADSHSEFTSSNNITTTSAVEWEFVVTPESNKSYPQRGDRGVPCERRAPISWTELTALMAVKNADLLKNDHPPLLVEEVVAVRLYTGPMYEKMNAALRSKSGSAFLVDRWQTLCAPNLYVTTIHACSSAVVKLSKLLSACCVYRGLAGATLPHKFLKNDEMGVRGGVEYAFMSTSTDHEQATKYASSSGSSVILQMQLGLIDRGADVSWIS